MSELCPQLTALIDIGERATSVNLILDQLKICGIPESWLDASREFIVEHPDSEKSIADDHRRILRLENEISELRHIILGNSTTRPAPKIPARKRKNRKT